MTAAVLVPAWLALGYLIASAYEYFGHRYMMHARMRGLAQFFEKHGLHHGRFCPWEKYSSGADPAGKFVGIDLSMPMMLVASSVIWGPVAFVSKTGAVTLAAFFALHGATWSAFHREIHYPRTRSGARVPPWYARTAYFRFVKRYHGRHHQLQRMNYTALCPLMDHVMGTFGGLA